MRIAFEVVCVCAVTAVVQPTESLTDTSTSAPSTDCPSNTVRVEDVLEKRTIENQHILIQIQSNMKFTKTTITMALWIASTASAFAPSVVSQQLARSTGPAASSRLFLFDKLFSTSAKNSQYPVMADESVMAPKKHGTSDKPVQSNLRWNCDFQTADRICNFNRHYAEYAGTLRVFTGSKVHHDRRML
jgi:hypothetical protein